MNQKIDKFLVGGVIILVILVFLSKIMPPSPGSVTIENEALLKRAIEQSEKKVKALTKKNEDLTASYERERDSLISSTKIIHDKVIVYRKAVEATDLRPDSLNLALESRESRKIIVAQSEHIDALLALNLKADSLLDLRLEIIQEQDSQIQDWSDRFENMVEQKDDLIKKERKRGHKKFIKGVLIGGVVVFVISAK